MPTQTPELGRRKSRREEREAATRQRRWVVLGGSAIVLVLVGLVVARVLISAGGPAPAPDSPAPDDLVAKVTSIPTASLEQVGVGSVTTLPVAVRADVHRDPSGLPLVTYIGAEYCPYCAAERWPLIIALSRFGTVSSLWLSHSATNDVDPNTPTFTLAHASYSSHYLALSAVELTTNVPTANGYQPLQTPTPAQRSLLDTYDAPPYVRGSGGSIPFIDFAGQYIVSGASFDVGLLRNMSQEQVAAALADTSTPQANAILGSANTKIAAMCSATGDNPIDVCGQPTVKSIEARLAAEPVPGR